MLARRRPSRGQRDVLRNKVLSKKSVSDLVPREKSGERNACCEKMKRPLFWDSIAKLQLSNLVCMHGCYLVHS
jgi:hypothetical protein